MWFLRYLVCKSMVTNPMFIPNPISAVFRIQSRGYKSYVRDGSDAVYATMLAFWTLKSDFVDRNLLKTSVSFPRQASHLGARVAFPQKGGAFWALCSVSSTGVAFERLRRVSSTGVAFWARCSVSLTGVALWAHWFFACFLYILFSFLHISHSQCLWEARFACEFLRNL